MIADGLVLALLTGAAFYALFRKLPRKLRRFLQKHVLLTDSVACILTYALFGGTVTALFAAAWLSVIVSILLILSRNPTAVATMEQAIQQINKWKDTAVTWVQQQLPLEEEPPTTDPK